MVLNDIYSTFVLLQPLFALFHLFIHWLGFEKQIIRGSTFHEFILLFYMRWTQET